MPKKSLLALVALALATGALTAVAACSSSSSSTPSTEDAGTDEDAETDSAVAPPENVLQNPSFESSGAECGPPWQAVPGSSLETATQGKTGSKSCKICNTGTTTKEVGVVVEVPIEPAADGKTPWALEAYFRDLDGGAGDGGNSGRISLTPKDSAGSPVLPGGQAEGTAIGSSTWRNLATPATPKKNAVKLEAKIGGLLNPSGCILVDDVTVYRAQ